MNHIYNGRKVGMHAAIMPIWTSKRRHTQFTMPSYVWLSGNAWLLRTVRTKQQAPVMNPKHIRNHSPILVLKSICTRQRNTIGSVANAKSETTDMRACTSTIPSLAPRVMHVPLLSQAAWSGWHWQIQMVVRIVLEKRRKATAQYSGRSSALLWGIRIKNRHIETLVHISVANV